MTLILRSSLRNCVAVANCPVTCHILADEELSRVMKVTNKMQL